MMKERIIYQKFSNEQNKLCKLKFQRAANEPKNPKYQIALLNYLPKSINGRK